MSSYASRMHSKPPTEQRVCPYASRRSVNPITVATADRRSGETAAAGGAAAVQLGGQYLTAEEQALLRQVDEDVNSFIAAAAGARWNLGNSSANSESLNASSDSGTLVLLLPALSPRRRFLVHQFVQDNYWRLTTFSVGQGDARATAICFQNSLLRAIENGVCRHPKVIETSAGVAESRPTRTPVHRTLHDSSIGNASGKDPTKAAETQPTAVAGQSVNPDSAAADTNGATPAASAKPSNGGLRRTPSKQGQQLYVPPKARLMVVAGAANAKSVSVRAAVAAAASSRASGANSGRGDSSSAGCADSNGHHENQDDNARVRPLLGVDSSHAVLCCPHKMAEPARKRQGSATGPTTQEVATSPSSVRTKKLDESTAVAATSPTTTASIASNNTTNSCGDTADNAGTASSEEDSWETRFDDNGEPICPEAIRELELALGKVKISRPNVINYLEFTPPGSGSQKPSTKDDEEMGHVLELYGFPTEFRTRELSAFLKGVSGVPEIRWVDDDHALAVFSTAAAALNALSLTRDGLIKRRLLSEASEASKAKAREAGLERPLKPRPETSSLIAKRLVSGALGIHVPVSREEREKEKLMYKEARERRRQTKLQQQQQKKDVWDED